MKHTVVPAQITTVEDKIAGNLTLQQLLLLAAPIFINFVVYLVLPRSLHMNIVKLIIMLIFVVLFWISAARFRGRLLITWARTIVVYNLRPRYHVFNKSDDYLRDETLYLKKDVDGRAELAATNKRKFVPVNVISDIEAFRLGKIIDEKSISLRFLQSRKRGLRVYITEVK